MIKYKSGTHQTKTKINVDDRTMSMKFVDIIVKFNIFYAKKHLMEEHSIFQIDLLSELVDETYSKLFSADFPSLFDFDDTYTYDTSIDTHICSVYAKIEAAFQVDIISDSSIDTHLCIVSAYEALDIPTTWTKSSIEQPPSLEFKSLHDTLKYAFLESNEKSPVIISSKLPNHEKKHKKEIWGTLVGIPGITLSMSMHKILLKDGAKVVRYPKDGLTP